jgi:hypothetical protein
MNNLQKFAEQQGERDRTLFGGKSCPFLSVFHVLSRGWILLTQNPAHGVMAQSFASSILQPSFQWK